MQHDRAFELRREGELRRERGGLGRADVAVAQTVQSDFPDPEGRVGGERRAQGFRVERLRLPRMRTPEDDVARTHRARAGVAEEVPRRAAADMAVRVRHRAPIASRKGAMKRTSSRMPSVMVGLLRPWKSLPAVFRSPSSSAICVKRTDSSGVFAS